MGSVKLFSIMLCCVLTSCHVKEQTHYLPYYNTPDFTPRFIALKDPDTLHAIPGFSFINQNGDTITGENLSDKITVVDFFFTTCPGICKKLTASLEKVQEAFKDDNKVMLLSHSVTPERDSVPVLMRYAQEHNAIKGKWNFVTGDKMAIYKIARTAYFADEDMGWQQDSTTFLHTENILLIDGKHHIRGVYKGTIPSEVDNLIADIKKLKQEE